MRGTSDYKPIFSIGQRVGRYTLNFAIVVIALAPCMPSRGADGDFVWAGALGGPDFDYGRDVAADDSGNVYATGEFKGTADFDPGAGTYNLTSLGGTDIYVCKLDNTGDLAWAVAFGAAIDDDVGEAIALDDSGNVLVAGYFAGTVDFDPGPGTFNLTSASNSIDVFVLKLDNDGNFVWARAVGSPDGVGNHNDRAYAIGCDGSGNVYTTGRFQSTVDFDPGAGTQNLTSNGNHDIFVLKLDGNGDYVWAKGIGGIAEDYSFAITVNGVGNVFLTGTFAGTVDFDPGPGTSTLTAYNSSFDAYVCRLDATGAFLWAGQLGGSGYDSGQSIAVDSQGNVYSTGSFVDTADFDPGPGTYNITSSYSAAYLSKLDASGNFIWARAFLGEISTGNGIAAAGRDYIYITGYFNGPVNFDPGFSDFSMTSSGTDAYVAKLNTAGGFGWAKQLVGGPSSPYGVSRGTEIATNANGDIYTTGYFSYEVDFDPGPGTFPIDTGSSSSYTNAFLLGLEGLVPEIGVPEVFAVTALDASPTNAVSVHYGVTFSEPVNGVDTSDFAVTAVGVTGASVTAVSGADDFYTVTVGTGVGDGAIRLDVVDDDSITASDDTMPLGGAGADNGSYSTGERYTIDKSAPTATIGVPSSSITANGPVTYTVTYTGADSVTLVAGDVSLNSAGDATGDVAVSGSGNHTRTVAIGNITGNGTLGISIGAGTATDFAGNSVAAAGPSATFDVDSAAIAVNIGPPSVTQTDTGPVSYVVTYDNVSSVTLSPADVILNGTGNANALIAVGPVVKAKQTLQRQVTLSSITGNGTLGISIAAGTASDGLGHSAPSAGPSAMVYVDNADPDVDSIVLSLTKGLQVDHIVTFTEAVTGVDVTDFTLTTTGAVTGAFVAGVSGSGAVYTVTVDSGTGNGTIRLDVIDDDTILDNVGNPLGGLGAGNGNFLEGQMYSTGTGTAVPLDWRWIFAALLAVGGAVIGRMRKIPRKT